jgi:hypothetical protein
MTTIIVGVVRLEVPLCAVQYAVTVDHSRVNNYLPLGDCKKEARVIFAQIADANKGDPRWSKEAIEVMRLS